MHCCSGRRVRPGTTTIMSSPSLDRRRRRPDKEAFSLFFFGWDKKKFCNPDHRHRHRVREPPAPCSRLGPYIHMTDSVCFPLIPRPSRRWRSSTHCCAAQKTATAYITVIIVLSSSWAVVTTYCSRTHAHPRRRARAPELYGSFICIQ